MTAWPVNVRVTPGGSHCCRVHMNVGVCVGRSCRWGEGWGEGQTPVSSPERGHSQGVWERPWLSSSAAADSSISKTNYAAGSDTNTGYYGFIYLFIYFIGCWCHTRIGLIHQSRLLLFHWLLFHQGAGDTIQFSQKSFNFLAGQVWK